MAAQDPLEGRVGRHSSVLVEEIAKLNMKVEKVAELNKIGEMGK